MLGFNERGDQFISSIPDIFSLDRAESAIRHSGAWGGRLVAMRDQVRYDRQVEFRKVLEAVLRRTLRSHDRYALRDYIGRLIGKKTIKEEHVSETLSKALQKRLFFAVASDGNERAFAKLSDTSVVCRVSSSSDLRGEMAILNRDIVRPGAFVTPSVRTAVAVLRAGPLGDDLLTPTPAGYGREAHLDENGIVRVGHVVKPGARLIGIEKPKSRRSPEEKLLRAIFGEKDVEGTDASLIYDGMQDALIIGINIDVARDDVLPELRTQRGVTVRRGLHAQLAPGEHARVAVMLAVEQPVETGDALASEAGRAVICEIVSGQLIKRYCGKSNIVPDILVASDHPWVRNAPGDIAVVRLALDSGALHGFVARSRSLGSYALVDQQALAGDFARGKAQTIGAELFEWLIAVGTPLVAHELLGRREPSTRAECTEAIMLGKSPPRVARASIDKSGKMHAVVCLLASARVTLKVTGSTNAFSLISDNEIISRSRGEITNAGTINLGQLKPERGGLFCAQLFGPTADYKCLCGKYGRRRDRGRTCDRCGVDVTLASVRYERMGHISLAAPIVHPWYFRTDRHLLSVLLKIPSTDLDKIIYCEHFVVSESHAVQLTIGDILAGDQLVHFRSELGQSAFAVDTGGTAIRTLLRQLPAEALVVRCREAAEAWTSEGDGFAVVPLTAGLDIDIDRIIFNILPVLPPALRPMVYHEGRIATADLNRLYESVVRRNNRVRMLLKLRVSSEIVSREIASLQGSVDSLFSNERSRQPAQGWRYHQLLGIEEHLQRYARQSSLLHGLLETHLDYSAKSIIIFRRIDSIDNARIPERLAWDLFRPVVVQAMLKAGSAQLIRDAAREIRLRSAIARRALEQALKNSVVLVHLKSTSYKMLAMRPELTDGLASGGGQHGIDGCSWTRESWRNGECIRAFLCGLRCRSFAAAYAIRSPKSVPEGPLSIQKGFGDKVRVVDIGGRNCCFLGVEFSNQARI